MSTISKVFVVLNFLLAMIFMVAAMTLYAKKYNWVNESRKAAQARNKYYKDLKDLEATYARVKKDKDETITKHLSTIDDLTNQVRDRDQKITSLEAKWARLNSNYDNFGRHLSSLEENLSKEQKKNVELQAKIDSMTIERNKAVAARAFAEQQAIEAVADLQESERQYLEASKRIHGMSTRILELEMLVDRAIEGGFDPRTLVASTPLPGFSGRVLQVDEVVGIVILNVGNKDKVSRGMEFLVSNNGKYVGKVRVRKVYDDMSSAMILKKVTRGKISINDVVSTSN